MGRAAPGMGERPPAGRPPGCDSPQVFLDPSVCPVLCQRFPARGFQDVWPWMRCRGRDGFGICLPSSFLHSA